MIPQAITLDYSLKAVVDTLKNANEAAIHIVALTDYLNQRNYQAVLNQLGLTEAEAVGLFGHNGFLAIEGVWRIFQLRAQFLPGEVRGDAICILRQDGTPLLRRISNLFRMRRSHERINVWYCFTNRSLYLFEDKPDSRRDNNYNPVRWRLTLDRIGLESISFDLTDSPTVSPIKDGAYEWFYDDDIFEEADLTNQIVALKAQCQAL